MHKTTCLIPLQVKSSSRMQSLIHLGSCFFFPPSPVTVLMRQRCMKSRTVLSTVGVRSRNGLRSDDPPTLREGDSLPFAALESSQKISRPLGSLCYVRCLALGFGILFLQTHWRSHIVPPFTSGVRVLPNVQFSRMQEPSAVFLSDGQVCSFLQVSGVS